MDKRAVQEWAVIKVDKNMAAQEWVVLKANMEAKVIVVQKVV
jgi:hypothetical protein